MRESKIYKNISEYVYGGKLAGNINYYYNLGSILGLSLIIQIITGILLGMYYVGDIRYSYKSVEYIMREVNKGWLIRYIHSNGASFFFIGVYIHIWKSMIYSSYIGARKVTWRIGVIILILMILIAFLGYSLVWGQMSYWGITVITSMFTTIPIIGKEITNWIWGGYSVGNSTLTRFYSLHYLLPFILTGIIIGHLITLHEKGGSNPLGVKSKIWKITFNPYHTVKDILGYILWIWLLLYMTYYNPNELGHTDNYIEADPLITPTHIVPEWYLLPYYAILRSIPSKLGGVLYMIASLTILLLLPNIGNNIITSGKFRPFYLIIIKLFALTFILLAWIGQSDVIEPYITIGFLLTNIYFILLLLLYILSYLELFLVKYQVTNITYHK